MSSSRSSFDELDRRNGRRGPGTGKLRLIGLESGIMSQSSKLDARLGSMKESRMAGSSASPQADAELGGLSSSTDV